MLQDWPKSIKAYHLSQDNEATASSGYYRGEVCGRLRSSQQNNEGW
jgi:hypothetical protein